MTLEEAVDRFTVRELLIWDEIFAIEAEDADKAAGRPVSKRRKRRL